MMRLGLAVAATLVLSTTTGAQLRQLPDDNLAYPVLVDLGTTTGTGFFVRGERHLFLVSASHILFNPDGTTKSPTAVTEALSTNPSESAKNVHKLDLLTLRKNGDLQVTADGDLVVIRMAALSQSAAELEPVSGVSILSETTGTMVAARLRTLARFADVRISNTVVVFGYPLTIGLPATPQIDFSRPLLRSGIVAGTNTQLTFGGNNQFPVCSPDGKRMNYASESLGTGTLRVKSADNSGPERVLVTEPAGNLSPNAWTRYYLVM